MKKARNDQLSGQVRYRDAVTDYVKAIVPLDKVGELLQMQAVQAVCINAGYAPGKAMLLRKARPRPWPHGTVPEYPFKHAYHPWKDLDAETFLAQHPTYDGRGVVIAATSPTVANNDLHIIKDNYLRITDND